MDGPGADDRQDTAGRADGERRTANGPGAAEQPSTTGMASAPGRQDAADR